MRTYKRKLQNPQIIDNIEIICRLCLSNSDELVSIFTKNEDITCELSFRIRMCLGLEVNHDDLLPNSVCKLCCEELETFYHFKKKCELSNRKLSSHLLAIKNNGLPDPATDNTESSGNTESNNSDDQSPDTEIELCIIENNNDDVNRSNKDIIQKRCTENQSSTLGHSKTHLPSLIERKLLKEKIIQRSDDGFVMKKNTDVHLELVTSDDRKVSMVITEEDSSDEDERLSVSFPFDSMSKDIAMMQLDNKCTYCQTLFKEKSDSNEQIRRQSSLFSCWNCGKKFTSMSALERHRRGHTGEKPFQCEKCSRTFTQKEVLRRHELTHLEKKPFECVECGKSFTQKSTLNIHERQHAPPDSRPLTLHRCPYCPKIFLYASGLSRHVKMHTGLRYNCTQCPKHFSDKSSLRRHTKLHLEAVQ